MTIGQNQATIRTRSVSTLNFSNQIHEQERFEMLELRLPLGGEYFNLAGRWRCFHMENNAIWWLTAKTSFKVLLTLTFTISKSALLVFPRLKVLLMDNICAVKEINHIIFALSHKMCPQPFSRDLRYIKRIQDTPTCLIRTVNWRLGQLDRGLCLSCSRISLVYKSNF